MVRKISEYLEDFFFEHYYHVTSFTIDTQTGLLSYQQYDKDSNLIDYPTNKYFPISQKIIELLLKEGWEEELGDILVLSLI